jgi:hypothetical protein
MHKLKAGIAYSRLQVKLARTQAFATNVDEDFNLKIVCQWSFT